MDIRFVHCFFEQSGTFKHAFQQMGVAAKDYDIENSCGETDVVCDLFRQIRDAHAAKPSVFDDITPDDLIFAFFPCIYFCESNMMFFCGTNANYHRAKLSRVEILESIRQRAQLRYEYYDMLLLLFEVCEVRQLRLIVENPYNAHHYLRFNFPYSPAVIDMNRRTRGDFVKKPTQYFFLNCLPAGKKSIQLDKVQQFTRNRHSSNKAGVCSLDRSTISPDYALNFICDEVLGVDTRYTVPTLFDATNI